MSEDNLFEMKLELIPIPVSDIERAKAFYVEKLGFNLDHDVQLNETMRVIQLTPTASTCSILIGTGMGDISAMKPGSIKGLHLVVKNIRKVREMLLAKDVEIGELIEYPDGMKYTGLSDPDGNSWLLQEMPDNL